MVIQLKWLDVGGLQQIEFIIDADIIFVLSHKNVWPAEA